MKKQKNYELVIGNESVVIKKFTGYDYYNSPKYAYIRISNDFSHKTRKMGEYSYCHMRFENDTLANWYSREHAINYLNWTEEEIKAAEKALKIRLTKEIPAIIENGKNHPAYNGMLAIVKESIKSYESDFYYHDLKFLGEYNPNKFMWFVRESGTVMIGGKHKYNDGYIEYYERNTKEAKCYFWTGKTLVFVENPRIRDYYNRLDSIQ